MASPVHSSGASTAITSLTVPDVQTKAQVFVVAGIAISSILYAIPPLSVGAALAGRSIGLLSYIFTGASDAPKEGFKAIALMTLQVAAATLGIIGIALLSPIFLIASLAVDIVHRVSQIGKNCLEGKLQHAFVHLCLLGADILMIAGIAAGSWQTVVASSVVLTVTVAYAIIHAICTTDPVLSSDPLKGRFYAPLEAIRSSALFF